MNLKTILLSILIISASTSIINAMSDEEQLQAYKQIGTHLFDVSISTAQLLKAPLVFIECTKLEECLQCQTYLIETLIETRSKASENYLRAYAIFNLHNTQPEITNPELNLVSLISTKTAPASLMIISSELINKITKLLESINQK